MLLPILRLLIDVTFSTPTPVNNSLRCRRIIHRHPEVVRADVELLAHHSHQEIPTCSKGGHHDRNQYNKKGQQAGRRQMQFVRFLM